MKKLIITIILAIIITTILINVVFAYNLELILSSDKTNVNVGDEVTVTLTLSKGMQAADFTVNYDSNLLEFKSASIGNMFCNTNTPGKVICSWFDTNDTNKFTFTFTAISSGTAKFSTTTENFYDGSLKSASSYNEGKLNITLLSSNQIINETNNVENSTNEPETITTIIEQSKNTNETTTTIPTPSVVNIQPAQTSTQNNEFIQSTATSLNNPQTVLANSNLPQAGSNVTLFIPIFLSILIIAIVSKMKLNKLKDI